MVRDEQFTRDYYDPEKRTCSNAVQIGLKGGSKLDEVVIEYPIGHPDRLNTLEELGRKFRKNARVVLRDECIDEVLAAVEKDDALVHDFVDLFQTQSSH